MSADQPILSRAGQANPQRAVAMFICLPLVAFLIFGLMLALGYERDRYGMIGLALLTIAIALIPFILDQARPADRRHMLLTFYCLLYLAHFGVPIFTHYSILPMPTDPPGVVGVSLMPADIMAGQVVALIALVSLLLGYALLPSRLTEQDIERRKAKDWPPNLIPVIAAMMLLLGWTVVIVGALGLIPAAIGTGVISTIGSSVIFGNSLLTVAVVRHRSRVALIMLVFAVPISAALGFSTGSKQNTLIVPAIILFTSMLLGGRIRARWIVVGTLVLTMLYPISEFYRQEILEGFKRSAVEALTDTTHTLGAMSDFFSSSRAGLYLSEGLAATAGRMDNLGIESVIVRDTPSVSPFQQGGTLVLFPMAFVPRLLWPDKPNIAIGQWITDTYGSGSHIQSNTGPSFIGDLYLNFGVFSVVIGMLVVGAVLRLFQTHFLGPNPTTIGILAAIVVIVQFHIKQVGSASYVLASTVFALAPVLIVYLAVGYLVRGQPSASRPAEMEPDGSGEGYRF